MKSASSPLFPLFVALAALASLASAAAAATSLPYVLNPYTFVGRISDARGVAFDDRRSAVLTVCKADGGTTIATTTTFFRDDSRNNYALQIPMSSAPVDGFTQTGDQLVVSATDDMGLTWSGVIDPAVVGAPGTVSQVDIVLIEDLDGDGIDDALYDELQAAWSVSAAAADGGTFDPKADDDGDGMSNLHEALLGTDPFDGTDVLHITSVEADEDAVALAVELPGGHVYALEESGDLTDAQAWKDAFFLVDESTQPRTILVTSAAADRTTCTIYLFPTSVPTFYRINAIDLAGE